MAERAVPIIDIGAFEEGSGPEKAALASAVDEACRSIGFLVISGHGVPRNLIDSALAAGRTFFDLPEAEKRRSLSPGGLQFLGYTAPQTRNLAATLGEERPPDLREIYTVGPGERFAEDYVGLPGASDLYAPNIWPERPSGFADVHLRLYRAMEELAERVMRIFAVALGLPETHFADKIDRHFSPLGSFHYPALDGPAQTGQLRCGAHTDFGSLTMLAMSDESRDDAPSGLQIRAPDGTWEDVTAGPQQLVVNIGDMMVRWTNDRWTSTLHRVVVPPSDAANMRRQSIGYFLHPNYDADVACLETCTSPDNPPKYPPVTAGAEMFKKLRSRIAGGQDD
tara:strand:+ start:1428 stop:2441 length:1014 start_codon:yes stop_codon:yes gene_type:complete